MLRWFNSHSLCFVQRNVNFVGVLFISNGKIIVTGINASEDAYVVITDNEIFEVEEFA